MNFYTPFLFGEKNKIHGALSEEIGVQTVPGSPSACSTIRLDREVQELPNPDEG